MKRKLLSLLVAGVAVSAAHADNVPTIYGKVDVTLNKYDFERPGSTFSPALTPANQPYTSQNNWQLESNSSRLGVKGDYPVAGDTKVIYKLEYELYADGSSSNTSSTKYQTFVQRNTYAGLQGDWGTFFAGKNDTPLKAIAAETLQLFKDLPLADYKYFLVGENRENNIIQYTTPKFSGFALSAQVQPGEDSGAKNGPSHSNHGIVDKFSTAATYNLDTLYLAIADDRNVQNSDTVRLLGQYGIGPVSLGAVWQRANRHYDDYITYSATGVPTTNLVGLGGTDTVSNSAVSSLTSANGLSNSSVSSGNPITDFASNYKSQDGYVLEAAWTINPDWVLKGQYGQSTSKPDATLKLSDTKAKNYVVGVDYKLNSNSKVFAYYAALKVDGDNKKVDGDITDKTFAVGYDFKF